MKIFALILWAALLTGCPERPAPPDAICWDGPEGSQCCKYDSAGKMKCAETGIDKVFSEKLKNEIL